MGLEELLSYHFPTPNRFQRLLQSLATTRAGAWLFSRTLPTMDSLVQRATGNRHTMPSLLVGLPVVDLTTTGRKSGQPRTAHLIAIPHRDTLALIGTNFGQPSTPAWVLNLEAQPHARVTYRGTSVDVRTRPAGAAETAEILAASTRYYPGYVRYQGRLDGRRLRVFVLETTAI